MSRIIVLTGISGSGKSTEARLIQSIMSSFTIIVNRDKIREQLFGFTEDQHEEYFKRADLKQCENQVTYYQDALIRAALLNNSDVIIDNTNLAMRYINHFKKFGCPIQYRLIDTPLETCVKRCQNRNRKVSREVIERQHQQLQQLKKDFDFRDYEVEQWTLPPYNNSKPGCIIFDIDGTLAIKSDRSAFEWHRVGEDIVNDPVWETLDCYYREGYKIIICTGRDGCCEKETKQWLANYSINYNEFHIRPEGNTEKDWLIKMRMWQDISKRYNILCIYDDRDQVVDQARRCNIPTFQVNYGSF